MTLHQVLQQRGIPFRAGRASGEITLCCPFCPMRGESVDTRFRLGVNVHKNVGHCFNCNYRSRSIAKRLLKALRLPPTVIDGEEPEPQTTAVEELTLPEGFHSLNTTRDSLDKKALHYLLQRGISAKQIERNKIGVTFVGRYAYRVVFPVYDGNKLQGLVTRALYATMKPRYLNSSGEKSLYNFRPAASYVLLEGVFKCLRVEQVLYRAGVNARACALLGHDITNTQLQQIQKARVDKVVLWPDPDHVGKNGMVRVAQKLQQYSVPLEVVIASQPADEATAQSLRESWQTRIPYTWAVGAKLLAK